MHLCGRFAPRCTPRVLQLNLFSATESSIDASKSLVSPSSPRASLRLDIKFLIAIFNCCKWQSRATSFRDFEIKFCSLTHAERARICCNSREEVRGLQKRKLKGMQRDVSSGLVFIVALFIYLHYCFSWSPDERLRTIVKRIGLEAQVEAVYAKLLLFNNIYIYTHFVAVDGFLFCCALPVVYLGIYTAWYTLLARWKNL